MQIEELTEALTKVGCLPLTDLLATLQAFTEKMDSLNDDIWTQEQCAQHLGVTPATVRQWTRDNGLPLCKIGAKAYYIKSDIISWMRHSSDAGIAEEASVIMAKLKHKRA